MALRVVLMRFLSSRPASLRAGSWLASTCSAGSLCPPASGASPFRALGRLSGQRAAMSTVIPLPLGSSGPSSRPAGAKAGVLLLNLGGPETVDDVEPFLVNLFSDPDIFQLPAPARLAQPALAAAIARRRAPSVREKYASIGGGSPIGRLTAEQAAALEAELRRRGIDAAVRVGMRYWRPRADVALREVQQALFGGEEDAASRPEEAPEAARSGADRRAGASGATVAAGDSSACASGAPTGAGSSESAPRLVLLPLFPHFSSSTTASAVRDVERELWSGAFPALASLPAAVVGSWHAEPWYARAVARQLARTLAGSGASRADLADPAKTRVLFSAHGVPKSYVQRGDPYEDEIRACADAVSGILAELWNDPEAWARIEREAAEAKASKDEGPEAEAAEAKASKDEGPEAEAAEAAAAQGSAPGSAPAAASSEALPPPTWQVTFQSRVGPVEWLRPYTDETIRTLGAEGVKHLVAVPIAFVSEHIETLEEMDLEYGGLAAESGVERWSRVPALNDDPLFVRGMADVVEAALERAKPVAWTSKDLEAGADATSGDLGLAGVTVHLPSSGVERADAILKRVSDQERGRATAGAIKRLWGSVVGF